MNTEKANPERVFAVYLTSRGFGYVIMEAPATLVDWGVKSARENKRTLTLARIARLIDHYRPEAIILEDCRRRDSHRCSRIGQLLGEIHSLAMNKKLRIRLVSRSQIRKRFGAEGAWTKQEIAQAIAATLPELAAHVPRYRKPWMSEDYRMAIFCAATLALSALRLQDRT